MRSLVPAEQVDPLFKTLDALFPTPTAYHDGDKSHPTDGRPRLLTGILATAAP